MRKAERGLGEQSKETAAIMTLPCAAAWRAWVVAHDTVGLVNGLLIRASGL